MTARRLLLGCAFVAGTMAAISASPQTHDVVTSARAALGGDAALNAVTSFQLSGSLTRVIDGHQMTVQVEMFCVLPDKFVAHERQVVERGPLGTGEFLYVRGFNGDAPIAETLGSGNVPPLPPNPTVVTATPMKKNFAKLTVPLFMASFAGAPITLTPSGVDAVDITGIGDLSGRLVVDAATHLPARLTFMDKPLVTFSTSSTVAVRSNGQIVSPPNAPANFPTDPTKGMADVPWETTFSHYKTENGLTWPRTMTTTTAGKAFETLRISKVKINPSIDPKKFTPVVR